MIKCVPTKSSRRKYYHQRLDLSYEFGVILEGEERHNARVVTWRRTVFRTFRDDEPQMAGEGEMYGGGQWQREGWPAEASKTSKRHKDIRDWM